jgi:hypothetical protein
MDDQNFKDLACKALALYRITQDMQKRMLELFFREFCELDQEQRDRQPERAELPF